MTPPLKQGPFLRVLDGGACGAVRPEPRGLPGRRQEDRPPDAVPARPPQGARRGLAALYSWCVLLLLSKQTEHLVK